MSSEQIIILVVIILYLLLNIFISLWISKRQERLDAKAGKGFLESYFMGGRSMGGLVLAMTTMATFASASTFLGGAGVASARGLVWVYLAVIQVPTVFLVLAFLGKKFAIVGRKTNAVTVIDLLRARYHSHPVTIVAAIALVAFSIAMMVAQFIGGAVLVETITGVPYTTGLLIFGITVILYTTIGGFKAVVTTDTIQGIIMVVGAIIVLVAVVLSAGGFDAVADKLTAVNPEWNIPEPESTPKPYLMSFWFLVGIATIGLPQTAVRGLGFKNTKSVHQAMVYGTVALAIIVVTIHLAGVYAPAVVTPDEVVNSDYTMPVLAMKVMPPVLAALFIAAPLSAIMSTVSSLLIMASSSVIKDIYLNYFAKDRKETDHSKIDIKSKGVGRVSMITTAVLGLIVILCTINPPSLIVWINLFAMGALECAFLCPTVGGMYWKRANALGSIMSSVGGIAAFMFFTLTKISIGGTTAIVPSIIISVILFIIGSLVGKRSTQEELDLFFAK